MEKSARRRRIAATTIVCTVFIGALVAPGAGATPGQAPGGRDRLPDLITGRDRPAHGRAAVEMLGDRLPEAARRNGMAPERLREILVEDSSAGLDGDARLVYEEPARAEGAAASTTAEAAALAPLSQSFLLHSRPGSQHTIYLDFDGHDLTDSVWTDSYGVATGLHPAWSLDTNRSAFSSAEREAVQSVWRRVAEDYAPFDVDVTTQDPGAAALTRTDPTDQVYGTRALISPSTNAVNHICTGGCGGFAYVGVFDMTASHANYQPAWIFPQSLGNDAKSIAEAVSHEVGHTFGLSHDGVTGGTSYYGGHDTWAPIMGVGYGRPITQWSQGAYTGANNAQDDFAVISGGGAPLLPDEAGGTTASTTSPPWGTAYITTNADRDVYALGTCSGPVSLAAEPAALSPNLDLELTLLKSNGNVASANPPSRAGTPARDQALGLDAGVVLDLNAGTNFVAVDGVGNGTPTAGYDGYGSVGGYTLSVNGNCSDGRATPSRPQNVTAAAGNGSATVRWSTPASPGASAITHYVVTRTGAEPVTVTGLSHTFSGLTPGKGYAFTVSAVNASGAGPESGASAATPNLPGTPGSVRGASGAAGGQVTAVARWKAPLSNGGAAVNGYRVYGYRLNDRGAVVQKVTSRVRGSSARSWQPSLHRGRWKFAVRARNAVGWGHLSARSKVVTAR